MTQSKAKKILNNLHAGLTIASKRGIQNITESLEQIKSDSFLACLTIELLITIIILFAPLNSMIVQKLLQAKSSHFAEKPPYKKPQYKSFRELLQLDRPRKKISYESQQQNEDFLQKLLNQEKEKEKDKKSKKKIRKIEDKSEGKPQTREKQRPSLLNKELSQKFNQKSEAKLNQPKQNPFFSVKELKQEQRVTPIVEAKLQSKSVPNIQTHTAVKKTRLNPVKLDGVSNPIFLDYTTKSIPKLTYLSSNRAFESTLSTRKQIGYQELIAQKNKYRKEITTEQAIDSNLVQKHILHKINDNYSSQFSFSPNIEPITQNWRYNLTFAQQNSSINRQTSEFVNRKGLFQNKLQQDKFVLSLKEYTKR